PRYRDQVFAARAEAMTAAENVGWGTGSARAVYDEFLRSPSHRDKTLSGALTHVAVGCVRDGGGDVCVTVNCWGSRSSAPGQKGSVRPFRRLRSRGCPPAGPRPPHDEHPTRHRRSVPPDLRADPAPTPATDRAGRRAGHAVRRPAGPAAGPRL